MTEGGGCGILWENRCLNRRLGLPVDAIANAVLTEAYKCVEKTAGKAFHGNGVSDGLHVKRRRRVDVIRSPLSP